MFLKYLSNLILLSIGPLMQPSSERMMSHSFIFFITGPLAVSCQVLTNVCSAIAELELAFQSSPPYTQGTGCFIIYIQQVVALHVSQVIGSITL